MKTSLALACALIAAAVPLSGQRLFRATASLVRLEVTVSNDAGGVLGLSARDFVVEDGGKTQTARVEEMRDAPLDLVLVAPPVSVVMFVAADQVARFEASVSAFVSQVQGRDRLGVVVAGAPPRRLRALEPGSGGVGIDALRTSKDNYAASFDAIALALRVFDESDRRRALVTFTNVADFRSVTTAPVVGDVVKRLDNAMVLLGLPVTIDRTVGAYAESGSRTLLEVEGQVRGALLPVALERFARDTHADLINLGDNTPSVLMKKLFNSLRAYYVVTYDMPEGKGWHPVKVKVNKRGVKVAVREGYFVDGQ